MKASLAVSSRKIIAILCLLVALVIALYLSGLVYYPNVELQTNGGNPPLNHTKTEMIHVDPKPMVVRERVEKQMGTANPIPLKNTVSNYKPATDVFDQVFSTASPNETFSIPTASSMR